MGLGGGEGFLISHEDDGAGASRVGYECFVVGSYLRKSMRPNRGGEENKKNVRE